MISRRTFTGLALTALPAAAPAAPKRNSVVHGIQFGLQSYVFSILGLAPERALDQALASMVGCGLGECDLFAPLVEPADLWARARSGGPEAPAARAELAKWRAAVSLDHYRAVRRRFEDSGIEIHGMSGFSGANEEEFHRTCDIAEVLGATLVTQSTPLSVLKRIAPVAEKRGITVGIQGRPDMTVTNPDAVSRPEAYEAALALSKNFALSFDIGDATGGGYDTLAFVKQHAGRTALLYLKDRRKDRTSVRWGEGDTPIHEILRFIEAGKHPIRCYLDCDYQTTDRIADVRHSYEYSKAAFR